MSTTFTLYQPVAAPAAITHARSAHFLAPASRDLILVRHNHVEIYSISEAAAATYSAQQSSAALGAAAVAAAASGLTDQPLLHKKFDKQLFGNVEGIW